jgi:ubiquinone/menaquinone biosynthesis C-methylase UbiE
MAQQHFGAHYGANPAANYERFFVPAIGAPLAADLIERAALQPGERVLDVACGTGVVARLASDQVGEAGYVSALDVNPGMLAVARTVGATDSGIEWHEASAEEMPLPDESFDAVLCQMGLQFVPDREAALREMRRVLSPGGRLLLNVPGPTPPEFIALEEALGRHVGPEAAGFVNAVFSLHETDSVRELVDIAGYRDITVEAKTRTLPLPPPDEFLWQYLSSTPLAPAIAQVDEERRAALASEVVANWRESSSADDMAIDVRVVTADARK